MNTRTSLVDLLQALTPYLSGLLLIPMSGCAGDDDVMTAIGETPPIESAEQAIQTVPRACAQDCNADGCRAAIEEILADTGSRIFSFGPATSGFGWLDGRCVAYRHYQYGSVYYVPNHGVTAIYGAIRDKWFSMDFERSYLGLPVSDEEDMYGTRYTRFEGGYIFWKPEFGAVDARAQFSARFVYGAPPAADANALNARTMLDLTRKAIAKGAVPAWRTNVLVEGLSDVIVGYDSGVAFGADYDEKWCSEFVANIYKNAGIAMERCKTRFPFTNACVSWTGLSDVATVEDLHALFSSRGRWVDAPRITTATAAPGDYIALRDNASAKMSHSALVVAVDPDYSRIWIMEGNFDNHTNFRELDYFPNGGPLNPIIGGIGKI